MRRAGLGQMQHGSRQPKQGSPGHNVPFLAAKGASSCGLSGGRGYSPGSRAQHSKGRKYGHAHGKLGKHRKEDKREFVMHGFTP